MIQVTLWFENSSLGPKQEEVYPEGMHSVIASFLDAEDDIGCRCFTADGAQPTRVDLDASDVLIFYGHLHHNDVDPWLVDYCWQRVLAGMGLIVPHSAHYARLFVRLMGTTCQLDYRARPLEQETLWVVDPAHPIAAGLGQGFVLEEEEVYREFHDVPPPDELVFISSFAGGEAFRSGMCWRRGAGRIFYFRPGHETCPSWYHPAVQQVMRNAVRWAAPVARMEFSSGPAQPGPRSQDDIEAVEQRIVGRNHPLRDGLDPQLYR